MTKVKILTYTTSGHSRHQRLVDDFGSRKRYPDNPNSDAHYDELRDNPVLEQKISEYLAQGWTLFQVNGGGANVTIVLTR